MHSMLFLTSIAAFAFTLPPLVQDPEWPDFRGPLWNGHALEANLPLEWSEDKNVSWKTAVPGMGWSSPVVGGGRVWFTTADEDGATMSVLALDLESGAIVIERVLIENDEPEKRNALNSYASPSCVIGDGRVYVHFGSYGTFCVDAKSGETLWSRRDMECDHMEGPGSSPVLWSDKLIVNADGGDQQYVIALDAKTGKTKWKTERSVDHGDRKPDMRKAYSTPIIIELAGKERLFSSGAEATFAYDPKNGKEVWSVRHSGFSMSSRPVSDGEVVYLNTGFMKPNWLAVRVSGRGDVTSKNVLWTYTRGVPTIPSPLLVGDRLYYTSNGGVVTCLDVDKGEDVWRERIDGEHCASPIYASGRLYFFDREGRSVVLGVGDKFVVLGRNQLDAGFMASPAVVGDALVLRTKTHVYRVEEVGG
ncbi:MAG: outer membrane protein assembly factor BamB [Planctomycetota bacterium]|jgi:outer membrane protein assembly factor BamB